MEKDKLEIELEEELKPKYLDSNYLYSDAFLGKLKEIVFFLQHYFNMSISEILNLPIELINCYVDFMDNKTPKLKREFDEQIYEHIQQNKLRNSKYDKSLLMRI